MKPRVLVKIIFVFFLIGSCKKDNTNVILTKTELLTSKTWMYNEYFINYNTIGTQVIYKRGKPNNASNYDAIRVKFNSNGTYDEITATGSTRSGTWKWINNETEVESQVNGSSFISSAQTIILNDKEYIWYAPSVQYYGKMIPQ